MKCKSKIQAKLRDTTKIINSAFHVAHVICCIVFSLRSYMGGKFINKAVEKME
jgi:hypothetical protein